jgi:hypothetical protein
MSLIEDWANSYGSTGRDTGHGIATDSNGNVYLTGLFDGSMNVGSYTLASNGSYDIFVIKLDTGDNVVWAKSYGGDFGDTGHGIATDSNGNIYLTGQFSGSMAVGSLPNSPLTSNGGSDIFVMKLDTDGDEKWAKNYGGTSILSNATSRGIATDSSGNVYLTGFFDFTTMLIGTLTNSPLTSNGGNGEIVVMKLDTNGDNVPVVSILADIIGVPHHFLGEYLKENSLSKVTEDRLFIVERFGRIST